MGKMWTNEQKLAISSIGGTVLVSAAAGSGKTSVLVERVIRLITDKDNEIDADRLLIVTFTNAAASEMKDRIGIAISKLIAENPNNNRLKRQEILLKNANISTIDSYCSKLIRENFYKLDISPKFRTADENEILLIKKEAMDSVLEMLYEDSEDNFSNLAEIFNYGRDDKKLSETIEKLYTYTRSTPFPDKWLDDKLDIYKSVNSLKDTMWSNLMFSAAKDNLEFCLELIDYTIKLAASDDIIAKAYIPALGKWRDRILSLLSATKDKNWDKMFDMLSQKPSIKLGQARNCEDISARDRIKANLSKIKDNIKKLDNIFIANETQCLEDISRLKPIIEQLFNTVKMYTAKYESLKREKNVLDFSDLLHFSLKLLVQPTDNGYRVTEFAQELQADFDMVVVDEYQDINEAQEMLFKALSKSESNLFMVGDVKQSIYRFRQSSPKIFINKRNSFDKYDKTKNNYPSKIYLTKNFRSRKGILDFTNFIFNNIFSQEAGEIEYTEEEELHFGATYYNDKQTPDVDVDIISMMTSDSEDKDLIQARHIAKKIKHMMATETIEVNGEERSLQFSDFCILLRSAKVHSKKIKKELLKNGIPTISEIEGTFFGTTEISVALSLLRIIDNPMLDIPLISVMLSPVCGFTPDDLSKIRINSPSTSIYLAVNEMSKGEDQLSIRCKRFLQMIEKFRILASTTYSDELINMVLEETGYFAMVQAMPNGEVRTLNLRMLLEYAKNYEQSGFKGLSGFINFIDRLKNQKADLSPATSLTQKSDAVRIMSIHKSKGLEFPVCIIANMNGEFVTDKDDISLNEKLGVSVPLRDKHIPMVKHTNLPKEAIKQQEKISGISEELRVLYVAMTRAKERLILVSAHRDIRKQVSKAALNITNSDKISAHLIINARSPLEWILMCLLKHKDATVLREIADLPDSVVMPTESDINVNIIYDIEDEMEECVKTKAPKITASNQLVAEIERRVNYIYPYISETEIPSKVTASQLTHKAKKTQLLAVPAFVKKDKMTAAQKGTAMHKFMQYSSYELAKQNVEFQLDKLYREGYLTKQEKDIIDCEKLKAFFNSDIYLRIENSPKVYRELLFTSLIKASEIDKTFSESEIVLQGAVDCAFIENGSVVIVDYKTDKINDIAVLKERYEIQVDLYKKALEQTLGLKVKECILYSLFKNGYISI